MADAGVPPRVLAAEQRREWRDALNASSLGCPCGHLRDDHERRELMSPPGRCLIVGCDCRSWHNFDESETP